MGLLFFDKIRKRHKKKKLGKRKGTLQKGWGGKLTESLGKGLYRIKEFFIF
jgi:hypothetical protein